MVTGLQYDCCIAAYSFDEPDAFDTKALVHTLQSLKVSPALHDANAGLPPNNSTATVLSK